MFAYSHGEYFALSFRRGITHGLPALLVLPFVVAGMVLGWDRWVRRRRDREVEPARAGPILALSVIGLITHPMLDWMNTYGMRWLLPFNDSWAYGDALFIIDPWLWLGLGGAVFLSTSRGRSSRIGWGVLGLVTSALILAAPLPLGVGVRVLWLAGIGTIVAAAATGRPKDTVGRRHLASRMGVLAVVYIAGMVASDVLARRVVLRSAEAAGLEVRDLMVAPTPGNPFVAEVEVLTVGGYVPGTHRWFASPSVELFPERMVPQRSGPRGLSQADVETIVSLAADIPAAHYWLEWARYPYARVERDPPNWVVTFQDARYDGQEGAGGLSGVVVRFE